VDNFVDKPPLTVKNTRLYAGFNKLPKWKAENKSLKINDLKNIIPAKIFIFANKLVAVHNF
jgi:hypothetical protein